MDDSYKYILFLHVVSVLGIFVFPAISMVSLRGASRAPTVEGVRMWVALLKPTGQLTSVAALAALLTGGYMVEDLWDWGTGWVLVSLTAFLVMFVWGPTVNASRGKAIGIAAGKAANGPVMPELRRIVEDPVLLTSEHVMTAASLGILYLMLTKPDTGESLLAMGIAVAAGILLSVRHIAAIRLG